MLPSAVMMITEECNRLSAEVARLAHGQGHKYPPDLRRRILDWVERAKQAGMTEGGCSARLGIKRGRFAYWRRMKSGEETSLALAPITVVDDSRGESGVTFVAPSGYRIEGVTLEQAVALLRAFP